MIDSNHAGLTSHCKSSPNLVTAPFGAFTGRPFGAVEYAPNRLPAMGRLYQAVTRRLADDAGVE